MVIVNWLFKPYSCEYEPNWRFQCYNRMWYILCVLTLLVTLGLVLALSWFAVKDWLLPDCIIQVAIGVGITMLVNLLQLPISCNIWEEHCELLCRRLMNKNS